LAEENRELRLRNERLEKQRQSELSQERERFDRMVKEGIEQQTKEVEHRAESRIYQLESDCRLYKAQIESKNEEITALIVKTEALRK
jgi:hypothetical protein